MKRLIAVAVLCVIAVTMTAQTQTPPSTIPPSPGQLSVDPVPLVNAFLASSVWSKWADDSITKLGQQMQAANTVIAAIPAGKDGAAGTISVGAVLTGAPGSQAAVTNSGTPNAAMLNFTIPQGANGASGTINIGSVLTGAPGSLASVTNSGTPSAAVLNFSIPQGPPGTAGTGTGGAPLWVGVEQVVSFKHSSAGNPAFGVEGLPGVSDKTFIYVSAGDYLDFPMNAPAGTNALSIALSSGGTPGTFHFEFPAGTKVGATRTAPNTQNWDSYLSVIVPVGVLPSGPISVRWVAETAGMNVAGVKPTKQ